ncbi:MAG: glycosyl hydrolase 115 family protein [Prevotellaceae bacterium]|nr:glycosyl hydrolase 115 family protein [Prevotellaceae bacterium]
MKKILLLIISLVALVSSAQTASISLSNSVIVAGKDEPALVRKMAEVMADDVERVTGVRPRVESSLKRTKGKSVVVLTTAENDGVLGKVGVEAKDLKGEWERYRIVTKDEGRMLVIVGSDARGLAYGVLHVSEAIGVSPWYWWADVPVERRDEARFGENVTSESPSVKYRGIFINDEDWGMQTWAAKNFEKELGDIGPRTYERVAELVLRLRGNMLAPAMHTCTGAFYSHPESQKAVAEWGIMVTTSHCEPMLFNNAAPSEWDTERDGEWNYLTNRETIWRKFDDRLKATAQYDNIYTTGMRGLHDEAMKGSADPASRAATLEKVFADQRQILTNRKGRPAEEIPQIFVPYKETLDVYDAGLRVPEDITLVWCDDNYGYMKRVSNEAERSRSGGSGVYYHLSYLGTPHDYLWLATTPPVLMYEELHKAYTAGADRYWLLNVGDIKPMEVETQQFFDMAWNIGAFNYENAKTCQAQWLSSIFGKEHEADFQRILDIYYRLAWDRKPEYMGYEMEWSGERNDSLHDSDFSFGVGNADEGTIRSAQQRLNDYKAIADLTQSIENSLSESLRVPFFEMLGYSVKSAYQMNLKFLMAQFNHETGSADAARRATLANDSIATLISEYNSMLGGKWNGMMSEVPPGFCAKYHLMPDLVTSPTDRYRLPDEQRHAELPHKIDLHSLTLTPPFRLIEGIGTDWAVLRMGEPFDPVHDPLDPSAPRIDIPIPLSGRACDDGCEGGRSGECDVLDIDTIQVCIELVPLWATTKDRSNRLGVSIDNGTPILLENIFEEWSPEWKLQVLENRKEFLLTLPLDKSRPQHTLSLIIGDPGQMVQKITVGCHTPSK